MLVREIRRLVFVVLPLLVFTFVSWKLYKNEPIQVPVKVSDWIDKKLDNDHPSSVETQNHQQETLVPVTENGDTPPDQSATRISAEQLAAPEHQSTSPPVAIKIEDSHDILYSVSTLDRKYFKIKMGNQQVMNPNIIPHPSLSDTWIIVAQQDGTANTDLRYFAELFCNAQFTPDGSLTCMENPWILPVEPTTSDKCTGKLAFASYNIGPHDARVFYGPQTPYTIYGSQSSHTCFGLWIQDLRELIPWGPGGGQHSLYSKGTELQRPLPWGPVEKNFFLFWDQDDNIYVHHDITPKRVFAKLEADGSVGPDLASVAALQDDQCLAKYLPKVGPEYESIHQSTNSLSITLCDRKDSGCVATDENTVLFTIYQMKKFYNLHALYEPYVMAFKRTAPFEIHGMSEKPLWINGRVVPEAKTEEEDPYHVLGQQMIYIVSMNWKKQGQNYHGFLDDELFLSFGIEDHDTAGIDIIAGDLFRGLGKCG